MKKVFDYIVIFVCIFGMYYITTNILFNNNKILEKYTVEITEENKNIYNISHEIINIEHKDASDLFNDDYVKFKNVSNNFKFIKKITLVSSYNLYESVDDNLNLSISLNDKALNVGLDNALLEINDENFKEKYTDVNYNEILKRYNFIDDFDLIYNVVKNIDNKVNSRSSKKQIIDKFFFDYILPVTIPYSKSSTINKVMVFNGDIYGYASIKDKSVGIILKKDNIYLSIIYESKNGETLNISREQIIDIVSTIVF